MESRQYEVRTEKHWRKGQTLTESEILNDLAIQSVVLGMRGIPTLLHAGRRLQASLSLGESVVLGGDIGPVKMSNGVNWVVEMSSVPLQLRVLEDRQTELLRLREQMRQEGKGDSELVTQLNWIIYRNRRRLALLNRDPEILGSGASKNKQQRGRDHIW